MPSKKEAQVHLRDKIFGSKMLTIFHFFLRVRYSFQRSSCHAVPVILKQKNDCLQRMGIGFVDIKRFNLMIQNPANFFQSGMLE